MTAFIGATITSSLLIIITGIRCYNLGRRVQREIDDMLSPTSIVTTGDGVQLIAGDRVLIHGDKHIIVAVHTTNSFTVQRKRD